MDDRLKKFAALVEKGSFTQAAKDLHISQPALSLAIDKLERELKASLLLHRQRPLELTDAGHTAYKAAMEHRTTNDNLRTELVELAAGRPKVAVGMIDSVAAALSGEATPLDTLESKAQVSITVNNSRYLREAVENREIDLAFVVHDNATHPHLDVRPMGAEPFVLICHPGRYAGFQAALKAKELPDFICYDKHSTTYGHLHHGLTRLHLTIRPTLYSTNPNIILNTVLRGRGIAALPYLLTKDLIESGKLAALKQGRRTLMIDCPLDAVRLRGRLLPRALNDFSVRAQDSVLGHQDNS